MKAAMVRAAGQSPVYGDLPEPVAREGEVLVEVAASAISHLARGRAAGTHYSAGAGAFPFAVGVDGVGRLADRRRVAFMLPEPPNGACAERTAVATARCVPVPDALDDVTAAALINPGMSSWAALTERALLKSGETVLVNGATGMSGRLAIAIARHLGAGKVIATGRDVAALATLGADETLPLSADDATFEQVFAKRVDIVLDYLWGESASRLLIAAAKAGPDGVPVRFVQIGSVSGGEIAFPAAALRSSGVVLMGSGLRSIALERLIAAVGDMLAAAPGRFMLPVWAVPLAEVEQVWAEEDSRRRTVLTTA